MALFALWHFWPPRKRSGVAGVLRHFLLAATAGALPIGSQLAVQVIRRPMPDVVASPSPAPSHSPAGSPRTARQDSALFQPRTPAARGRPARHQCPSGAGAPSLRYSLPKIRSTTQQPRTCGPALRQWLKMSALLQPDSSRASASMARRMLSSVPPGILRSS